MSALAPFLLAALLAPRAPAQAPDTLHLAQAHALASRHDPREAQLAALEAQSSLRLRGIAADRRPTFGVELVGQYLSDVPRIPFAAPGTAPAQPHDQYDARVVATQPVLDPTLGARTAVERAQHAEARARVRIALFGSRQLVNDAYFGALRAQVQRDELTAAIQGLEAQLAVASARVREGAALPSEALTIQAELLRRRQQRTDADIARIAALTVLADLTGAPHDTSVLLALPDLAAAVAAARGDSVRRSRPEFERFGQARALLASQQSARIAQDRPRVSAFGRAGYGRPGLNPLASEFDSYWLAGVQLQWNPWSRGARARDAEVLSLQRQIVTADERAFTDQLRRAVTQELAVIDRLQATLPLDDEIIALRERIAAEYRARLAEAAITPAESVSRQTELLAARLDRAMHRVALAEARARLLTTLGLEVH